MEMRAAARAVYDHFLVAWGGSTPVVLGNEAALEPSAPWVRLTLVPMTREQQTIGAAGNRVFEAREQAIVQIFVPSDAGDGPLRDLQQAALDVFEGASVTSGVETLYFFDVEPEREDDEPHLLVGSVTAIARYQERK